MGRVTNFVEKLLTSVINAAFVLLLSLPFYLVWGTNLKWKLLAIILFFIYELIFSGTKHKRDLGMMAIGSFWQQPVSIKQYVVYNLFYTLSFATIFFHIWFTFDLLLINLLLIQLPFVLLTGTTLHGNIGKMVTIKKYDRK